MYSPKESEFLVHESTKSDGLPYPKIERADEYPTYNNPLEVTQLVDALSSMNKIETPKAPYLRYPTFSESETYTLITGDYDPRNFPKEKGRKLDKSAADFRKRIREEIRRDEEAALTA